MFQQLFELHCPVCADGRLAVIDMATDDEIEQGAAAGDPRAIEMLDSVKAGRVRRAIWREYRERLASLPQVDGKKIEFSLTEGGEGGSMTPEWLVLNANGVEIYREPSGFEGWKAVIDIGEAIVAQYGKRIAFYDPGDVAIETLGDAMSAPRKIEAFLKKNGITPPRGHWVADGD